MGASTVVLAIILLVLCLMAILGFFFIPYFLMRDVNLNLTFKKQEQDQNYVFENVFNILENASALEYQEDSNKP